MSQWAGDEYRNPLVLIDMGYTDRHYLAPLYTKLHDAIRTIDDQHIIFFEPAVSDYGFWYVLCSLGLFLMLKFVNVCLWQWLFFGTGWCCVQQSTGVQLSYLLPAARPGISNFFTSVSFGCFRCSLFLQLSVFRLFRYSLFFKFRSGMYLVKQLLSRSLLPWPLTCVCCI